MDPPKVSSAFCADDFGVDPHVGAEVTGGGHDGPTQGGIVRLAVEIPEHGTEAVGPEAVELVPRAGRDTLEAGVAAQSAQHCVKREARAKEPAPAPHPHIDRHVEGNEAHEVGGDAQEDRPLDERLAYEAQLAGLEVPEAAVDQLARAAGRSGGGHAALQQHDGVAPCGQRLRHAGAEDTRADDEDVRHLRRRRRRGERRRSRRDGIVGPSWHVQGAAPRPASIRGLVLVRHSSFHSAVRLARMIGEPGVATARSTCEPGRREVTDP
jgi:hypothetical protein